MALTQAHRERCQHCLAQLLQRTPGLRVAALGLRDGRPFAQAHRAAVDASRLAAMSSSLAALGGTVLRIGRRFPGPCPGGRKRLPELSGLMILAVMASPETRLGLVLGQARTCAVAVGEVLSRAVLSP